MTHCTALTLVAESRRVLEDLLAALGLLVLVAVEEVEEGAAQDDTGVHAHGEVDTCWVSLLCLLLHECDGRDDTANTTPCDDESGRETALGLRSDRCLSPGEDEGYVGVASAQSEEDARVTRSLLLHGEVRVHGRSDDKERSVNGDCHTAAVLDPVSERGGGNGGNGGPNVWGSDEELSLDVGEAHSEENDGKEVGKRVGSDSGRAEHVAVHPQTPVAGVVCKLCPSHHVDLGVSAITLNTSNDNLALLGSEELGLVGEIGDEDVSEKSDTDGNAALDLELVTAAVIYSR